MTVLHFEPVSYPVVGDLRTVRGLVLNRTGFRLRLTEHGHAGFGEVLPLPGWSTLTVEAAAAALAVVAAATNPLLASVAAPLEVRSGIDGAAWNLRAAREGCSLGSLLGARVPSVEVNALLGGGTLPELAEAVRGAIAEGYRTLKVKLGFSDDSARLQVLAEEVPDDVAVRLDPNRAWAPHQARVLCARAVSVLGDRLEYIEDPVADVAALAILRGGLGVRLAVDELARGAALTRVLDDHLADVVVVKPALSGGVSGAIELAHRARSVGAGVVVSSTYDGPDALMTWCALAAALGPDRAHGLGTAGRVDAPGMQRLLPVDGHIELPRPTAR